MAYEAIRFTDSENNILSRGGFATEEEAWNYVYQYRCDRCKEIVKKQGENALAACDGEWMVYEEEQNLNKVKQKSSGDELQGDEK